MRQGIPDPRAREVPNGAAREANSQGRTWPWRVGFGLATVWAWLLLVAYYAVVGLGSLGDCFGAQPCTDNQVHTLAAGRDLGLLFAACFVVASCLCIAAVERNRRAAAALAILSGVIAVLSFIQPSPESGMKASSIISFAVPPLLVLALLRWRSLRRPALRSTTPAGWQVGVDRPMPLQRPGSSVRPDDSFRPRIQKW